MAGSLLLKKGTKIQLAFDVPVGHEPQFNMLCTFNKALDESAFLVSAPMVDGKKLVPDESQKLLFKYTEGDESNIVAGYVDDTVKEGIRSYLKIRRVAEQRHFVKVHAGYLGTEFQRRGRMGKGRDHGYFQQRSCSVHEPLV